MLHVSLEVNIACFAGMAVLAQTILVFIIIIIIITFLNEMIDNVLNAKTYVFHMSRLTDCDIREQRKWNKSFNKVPLSWCQRDFQKDEQDGKVFNQEMNVDTAGWRLSLMQRDVWIWYHTEAQVFQTADLYLKFYWVTWWSVSERKTFFRIKFKLLVLDHQKGIIYLLINL